MVRPLLDTHTRICTRCGRRTLFAPLPGKGLGCTACGARAIDLWAFRATPAPETFWRSPTAETRGLGTRRPI